MLSEDQFFSDLRLCFARIDDLRALSSATDGARARMKYVIFISILMSNDCIHYTPQTNFRNVPPRWAKSSSNPLCKWLRDYRNAKQYTRSQSSHDMDIFFLLWPLQGVFERFVCDAVRALSYFKSFIIPKIMNIDKTSIFAHCRLPWFLHLRSVATVHVRL